MTTPAPRGTRSKGWRSRAGMLAGLVALALATLGSFLGTYQRGQCRLRTLQDGLAARAASGEVVIVGVDEVTLAEYGGTPIRRRYQAEVLNALAAAGAKRIFCDRNFSNATLPEDDQALQDALKMLGPDTVALPVVTLCSRHQKGAEPVEIKSDERFAQYAARVSADLFFEHDQRVRTLGRNAFGFAAEQSNGAVWLATGNAETSRITQIDYRIQPASIPTFNYLDFVERRPTAMHAVKDKHVILGITAQRVVQSVPVPLHGHIERPYFLALAAETELSGTQPQTAGWWQIAVLCVPVVLVLGAIVPRVNIVAGGFITVVVCGLWFAASLQIYQHTNVTLQSLIPYVAILATYAGALIATNPAFEQTRHAAGSLVKKVDFGLAKLFHSGVDAIVTFTPEGKILTVNETAEKLFDIKAEDVIGQPLSRVLPDAADALLQSASGQQPGRLEATVQGIEGASRHVDLAFNAMPSDDGWVGYASIRDISDLKAREEELKHLATHDTMTGLPNRAAFERHLEATRRFASETGRTFAVFLMDLNKFKQVNDTLGHHVGDALLVEVAERFRQAIRSGDFVARLGGDEFAVITAPPTKPADAEIVAHKMVESIRNLTELEGHTIETGTSIGIAFYPSDSTDSEELVRLADEAMYLAKRDGTGFQLADSATTSSR